MASDVFSHAALVVPVTAKLVQLFSRRIWPHTHDRPSLGSRPSRRGCSDRPPPPRTLGRRLRLATKIKAAAPAAEMMMTPALLFALVAGAASASLPRSKLGVATFGRKCSALMAASRRAPSSSPSLAGAAAPGRHEPQHAGATAGRELPSSGCLCADTCTGSWVLIWRLMAIATTAAPDLNGALLDRHGLQRLRPRCACTAAAVAAATTTHRVATSPLPIVTAYNAELPRQRS